MSHELLSALTWGPPLVEAAREELARLGDPAAAPDMQRYMKHRFRFAGVKAPARRELSRRLRRTLSRPSWPELADTVRLLWAEPWREQQYLGLDLLRVFHRAWDAGSLLAFREWIKERSWWDTVDSLASHMVGGLVRRYPELAPRMDDWIADGDFWIRRTALLHQLSYKADTDTERLFDFVRRTAHEREFFIRKAIGWALREYSKTDPLAVETFVAELGPRLSGLSRREALKVLEKKRRPVE